MDVVISKAKKNGIKIYHRQNCLYAKRIKPENKRTVTLDYAERKGYCGCKYCSKLRGDIRVQKKAIEAWENKNNMRFIYHARTETLYIRTEVAFWKVFIKPEIQKYLLYHCNKFTADMSDEKAEFSAYHRQKDVKATGSLENIVDYIIAHDRAKKIIAVDYRNLPQSSKKQKMYYQSAEKKARRAEHRRLDNIFMRLERENSDLRAYSFC